MKKKILKIFFIYLISLNIYANDIIKDNKIKHPISFKLGYSNININHQLLGNETIESLEYIAAYDFNSWGISAEYEHQKIIKLKSEQYAIGGQYTFFKTNHFYALTALGIGITNINYTQKNYKTTADYIYYPLNIELGYMPHPNFGAYITYGYKWLKNRNTKVFYKDTKISDESSHDLNIQGHTYSIGLRIAFQFDILQKIQIHYSSTGQRLFTDWPALLQ